MKKMITRPKEVLISSKYGKSLIESIREIEPEADWDNKLPFAMLIRNIPVKEWGSVKKGAIELMHQDKARLAYNCQEKYFYKISEERIKNDLIESV